MGHDNGDLRVGPFTFKFEVETTLFERVNLVLEVRLQALPKARLSRQNQD